MMVQVTLESLARRVDAIEAALWTAAADHRNQLKYPESERGRRLIDRRAALPPSEVIGVSIVSVEERMRGWLAAIAKEKRAIRQVAGYRELARLIEF